LRGVVCVIFGLAIPECDRHTHRHTDTRDSIYPASIASHANNHSI